MSENNEKITCKKKSELALEYDTTVKVMNAYIERNLERLTEQEIQDLGVWKTNAYLFPRQLKVMRKILDGF